MYITTPSPLEATQRALNRSRRAFRDRHSASRPGGAATPRLPVLSGQARTRRSCLGCLGVSLAEREQGSLTIDTPFSRGDGGRRLSPLATFLGREILAPLSWQAPIWVPRPSPVLFKC
jgi:hypothetical protein